MGRSVSIKVPQTEDEWKKEAKYFQQIWNFSRCYGAVDSKHISIKQVGRAFVVYLYLLSLVPSTVSIILILEQMVAQMTQLYFVILFYTKL